MLKKRILLIPLIIAVLLNCITFTAFADDNVFEVATRYEWLGLDAWYPSEEELLGYASQYNVNIPDGYIYVKYQICNGFSDTRDQYFFSSALLYPQLSVTVSESNGIYDFSNVNWYSFSAYTLGYLNIETGIFDNRGLSVGNNQHGSDLLSYDLSFDSDNVAFYTGEALSGTQLFTGTAHSEILDIVSHIDDFTYLSGSLNVSVSFSPSLSGTVDRSLTINGNVGYMQNLFMSVTNNSSFPIQYMMYIYKKDKTNLRTAGSASNVSYDDDPVFCYYKDDWVYTQPYDNDGDQWALETSYQYKPTHVHYVYAGQTDEVKFDFSQINLQEGVEYECVVMAQKCDYDRASEKHTQVGVTEDRLYTELYQVDYLSYENVYYSTFTMLQYNDVKYDPNNSSWGVLPYSGSSGQLEYQKYATSRHAVRDDEGNIDYHDYSLYDDPTSWRSKQEQFASHGNNAISDLYTPSNSSYGTILSKISVVFTFIGAVLGFFPSDVLVVYNLALWSIIILLIIRRLH